MRKCSNQGVLADPETLKEVASYYEYGDELGRVTLQNIIDFFDIQEAEEQDIEGPMAA